jgi:hypothetical protein
MAKIISVFLTVLSFGAFSQSAPLNEEAYLQWFDSQIGVKSTGLINGLEYNNPYFTKMGFDQYYQSPNGFIGDLIYDNQYYTNVNLLYDLYTDDLIFGFNENELVQYIKLVKDKVSRFNFNNKQFVNIKDEDTGLNGFFEVLYGSSDIVFYKGYKKIISKQIDFQKVYYSFSEKTSYYLKYENSFYSVNSKKSLTKQFPQKRQAINKFYSKNRYLFNNDFDQFMVKLVSEIVEDKNSHVN